jgi:hypothetical protein
MMNVKNSRAHEDTFSVSQMSQMSRPQKSHDQRVFCPLVSINII